MTVSLKRNVIANGVGQGWRALMSLAFVPIYIKYVGIEAYGLIGIFAMLQSWLTLFDMGIRPALGREMARFSGGAHGAQSIRNLLRSVEVLGACIAGIVALCIWGASGWLASNWLRVEKLPLPVVARALTVMGIVTSLRFIEDIYVNCLAGLELQVEQNVVICITSTARGLGAVAILAWISPTLEAFFIWQALISVVTVALFSSAVYRALPKPPRPARFSLLALRNVWRFAAGVMAITCLALLLSQTDKILLSRLLTLKVYGYYTLAGTVANGLAVIAAPINAAFYPRFTALTTVENEAGGATRLSSECTVDNCPDGLRCRRIDRLSGSGNDVMDARRFAGKQGGAFDGRSCPGNPAQRAGVYPLSSDAGPRVDRAHHKSKFNRRRYPRSRYSLDCAAVWRHGSRVHMGGSKHRLRRLRCFSYAPSADVDREVEVVSPGCRHSVARRGPGRTALPKHLSGSFRQCS